MKASEIRAMKNGLFATDPSVADLMERIGAINCGETRACVTVLVGIAVNTALEHVAELMDYDESQVATPEQIAAVMAILNK